MRKHLQRKTDPLYDNETEVPTTIFLQLADLPRGLIEDVLVQVCFSCGPPLHNNRQSTRWSLCPGKFMFCFFLLGNLVSNRRACFVGLVGLSSSLRKYPLYLISPVCPFPSPNYFGAKNSFPLFNSMETSSYIIEKSLPLNTLFLLLIIFLLLNKMPHNTLFRSCFHIPTSYLILPG